MTDRPGCMHKGFAGRRCRRRATTAIDVYDAHDFRQAHPTHVELCQPHMDRLFPRYPEEGRIDWLNAEEAARWRSEVAV